MFSSSCPLKHPNWTKIVTTLWQKTLGVDDGWCWYWAALVWTDGQVVAVAGSAREPGVSERPAERQPETRAEQPSVTASARAVETEPGQRYRAADTETWLRLRVSRAECACHHSYQVPSAHHLMGTSHTPGPHAQTLSSSSRTQLYNISIFWSNSTWSQNQNLFNGIAATIIKGHSCVLDTIW